MSTNKFQCLSWKRERLENDHVSDPGKQNIYVLRVTSTNRNVPSYISHTNQAIVIYKIPNPHFQSEVSIRAARSVYQVFTVLLVVVTHKTYIYSGRVWDTIMLKLTLVGSLMMYRPPNYLICLSVSVGLLGTNIIWSIWLVCAGNAFN